MSVATATASTSVGPHLFWIISRAAGIAALVLASAAVCLGLLMGGRLMPRRGPDLRVTHEALSLATLGALVVHGASLLGDSYLHPTIADVALPFLTSYRTFWTSLGIVSFWALTLLGLGYYARARIGVQRWRVLHRFTALAWLLGLAHSLGAGTDAGQAWFLAMTAIVAGPPLVLLVARHLGLARHRTAASAGTGSQPPAAAQRAPRLAPAVSNAGRPR
jgi:sulfoxide reductase heme-binding subunit YedZ